jgi:hypothetical protein
LENDMAGGLKDGSNMKAAVGCAEGSRKAKAGTYHGGKPPSGPKAEPVKVNGIKAPKERGLSK